MKFTTTTNDLAAALDPVAQCASHRSPNPIVLNALLEAEGDSLTLTATDFSREVQVRLNGGTVRDIRPGAMCLAAQRLRDCVKILPRGEDVTISATTDGARITCGRTVFNVRGQDPDDFPRRREPSDEATSFRIPARRLSQMLGLVTFAIAGERTRYSLNGVLVDCRGGRLSLVGSDGKRLALASIDHDVPDVAAHVVLPRAGIDIIQWACAAAGAEDEAVVTISVNHLHVQTPGADVTTQLVAGLYPAFRQILPDLQKHTHKAVLNRARFASDLRRAEQFTSADSVSVRFAFTRNSLVMTSRVPDEGEAEVGHDCEFQGELTIGFDPAFLRDLCRIATADDLVLQMKDADSAGVVETTIGDVSWYYLVMPTEIG